MDGKDIEMMTPDKFGPCESRDNWLMVNKRNAACLNANLHTVKMTFVSK